LKLADVTAFAVGRTRIFHGMACSAHSVGGILAKIFNMARSLSGFSVTTLAFSFLRSLVSFVGKCNAIFKFENFRIVSSKRGCCNEHKYTN